MSIATQIERLENAKQDIKTAIENKGVGVGNGLIDTYADKINQIETGITPTGNIDITANGTYDITDKATATVNVPTGGGSQYPVIEGTGKHEVRFIDFDGTVLKIQYVNDGEDATPPELPEHELLTFIGWNNETYLDVTRDNDVGASYTTSDDKTHIWHFVNEENGLTKTLNIQVKSTGSGKIEWGDGTTTNITSGTGRKYYTHTYTEGTYEIVITHSGKFLLGYNNNQQYSFFGDLNNTNFNLNTGITKVYFSDNCVGVSGSGFKNVTNLEVMSVGNANNFPANAVSSASKLKCAVLNPTFAGGNWGFPAFDTCDLTYFPLWESISTGGLVRYSNTEKFIYTKTANTKSGYGYNVYYNTQTKIFSLPESVTSISTYLCYFALNLKELIIPEGVTTIGNYMSYQCRKMKKIVLPSTLTSLGNYAFYQNVNLTDIYIYATTPPTLGGTSCFNIVPTICKIHVPADSLDAYKTATNWSAQASKMVGDL